MADQGKQRGIRVEEIEKALQALELDVTNLEAMEAQAQRSGGKIRLTQEQIKNLGEQLSVRGCSWPLQTYA